MTIATAMVTRLSQYLFSKSLHAFVILNAKGSAIGVGVYAVIASAPIWSLKIAIGARKSAGKGKS